MKKKILILSVLVLAIFTITGCDKKKETKEAIKFKEDYESLNGVKTASGKEHRTLTINKENPFIIVTATDIIEKIENKETFYVYFGSKLCPWCRSVIEKAVEVANLYGIDKIYYVDVWDNEGNEILRDKYVLDDAGNSKLVNEGTEEYFKLLEYFNDLLPEYEFAANKNGGSKLDINEKRIYLPTFIQVKNGVAIKITDGLSDNQTGSRDELTEEMLNDEQEKFEEFFTDFCDEAC